ncbi:uncharacterized protein [Amphiura filiformis]|uniref:uncharacterized protein n=1 Tax=Amphiura filiformis TaxID=82378 RepID=UPI003B20CB86
MTHKFWTHVSKVIIPILSTNLNTYLSIASLHILHVIRHLLQNTFSQLEYSPPVPFQLLRIYIFVRFIWALFSGNMPVDTTNKPKMSEGRKSSKPLMEKRRRARINDSLCQLKSLILEATNKDTSRHSKLEKADILEMTVKYLRNMQRHQLSGSGNPDPNMLNRYRLGYSECISEVSRYLNTSESAVQLRTQLIGHLANCCNIPTTSAPQQQQQTVAYTPAPTPAPIVATAAMGPSNAPLSSQPIQVQIAPSPVTTAVPTQVEMSSPNGNVAAARVVSGIPVANVPSAVTTGEITVVLPPQAFQGGQLPSHFIPVYAQSVPSSMLSPASSTSSQCLPSPTSSVETPSTPTQQTQYVSYQYQQQVPKQELPSPSAYEQQVVPQTVSYLPGGIVTSPLMGSVAPAPTSTTCTVQAPPPQTLVAMPANVLTPPAAEPSSTTVYQQHHMPVSQPHIYHQSPPKTVLRTVNINVHQQQQCATGDENSWKPFRPW